MALEPNNELLNYDFETYRVSLNKLQTITKELNCELYQWNSRNEIANFSQIKAFGIHNNLILDIFFPNNVYIISKNLEIFKVTLVEDSSTLFEPVVVYTDEIIPPSSLRRTSPILFFPSTNIACFYDGLKLLHIIRTSNREDFTESWKCLCSADVNTNENSDFTLLECRIELKDVADNDANLPLSGGILHCCFLRIYDGKLSDKNVELIWNSYNDNHKLNELTMLNTKTWRGSTPPEMVTFTKDFKSLEIVGDHSFRYIPSDLTAHQLSKDNIKTMASWWQESNDFISVHYYVKMSLDEFTVDILYPEDIDQELVILFHVKDKEPLELYKQKMSSIIDKTLSKWYLENEMLIIELKKVESTELEDVAAKRSKVSFDQYEDVDNCDDCDLALISFNALSGNCTEEIGISKNEWLFSTRLEGNCPTSACIRYNVDGLVWNKGDSGSQWDHRHTLNAFGYVSAAKVDRKFITCSLPESEKNGIKFAAISDWKRSICVFLQCKQMDEDMSVKNRNTGKAVSNTADEFFITFEKCQEILGMVVNKKSIFVLYRTSDDTTRVSVVTCA